MYKYKNYSGQLCEHTDLSDDGIRREFTKRSHLRVINRSFDKNKYKKTRLSNLTINVFDANYAINRIIELGRNGIVVYTQPNPKKYFK